MSDVPKLAMTGVTKRFGGVLALDRVDFELRRGEVMALVGDNGAGKSTLIKIISGAHRPDAGEMRLDGVPVEFAGPQDAWAAGVATIYQELALAGKMSTPTTSSSGANSSASWPASPSSTAAR